MTTFENSRGSSNIDLTVSTLNMLPHITNWNISMDENLSDHGSLTFQVNCQATMFTSQTSNFKFNTKTADWEKFKTELHNNLSDLVECSEFLASGEDLDSELASLIQVSKDLGLFVDEFYGKVINACIQTFPTVRKRGKIVGKTVSWWNEELSILRKKVNASRRRYQRTYNNQELRQQRKKLYIELRLLYKNKISTSKLESWKRFCSGIPDNNPWNFIYKAAAGKLRRATCVSTVIKENGKHTESFEETIEEIFKKLVPQDDSSQDLPIHKTLRLNMEEDMLTPDDILFSRYEVERAIYGMKPGKAPGWDGLTSDILKKLCQFYPAAITAMYVQCLSRGVFPSCWKRTELVILEKSGSKDMDDPSRFRPISLLPVAGKVLEKLLIDRIMHHLDSNHMLSDKQFGFRPQTSTVNALKSAMSFIEEYLEMKWEVLLISLDVRGAFDAAWWPSIFKGLREYKCPRNLYYLSRSYFTDRRVSLSLNSLTKVTHATRGCPQGSCCGPGFWVLFYNSLLRLSFPGRSQVIAFADDILILVAGKTELEASVDGNRILKVIESWATNNKIQFNENKSKAIHLSRKMSPETHSISVYLGGERLEMVNKLKYLGVMIDNKLNWSDHIEYICEKSWQLVNTLSRAAKVHWGLGSKALQVIYKGAFLPFMLYAVPIWHSALSKKVNKKKIERIHRILLIRLIKGYRTISYSAACAIAGVKPILLQVQDLVLIDKVKDGQDAQEFSGALLDRPVCHKEWQHPATIPAINTEVRGPFEMEIYTDGSKDGDCVGCAFAVFQTDRLITEKKFRLDGHCSNNQAEQLAIVKALEWLEGNVPNKLLVNIATDSRITLDSLSRGNIHFPLIEKIRHLLVQVEQRCCLSFSWVKAHVGIDGNEHADMLAKSASRDVDIPSSYIKFPLSALKRKVLQQSLLQWEAQWSNSLTGALTREFLPSISDRLKMRHFTIDHRLTQIISGHGKMASYLHRFGIISSPTCSCNMGVPQTVDHLLWECDLIQPARHHLQRSIVTQNINWPPTKRLLLHPHIYIYFINFVNSLFTFLE